jgi:hypothetical protein
MVTNMVNRIIKFGIYNNTTLLGLLNSYAVTFMYPNGDVSS